MSTPPPNPAPSVATIGGYISVTPQALTEAQHWARIQRMWIAPWEFPDPPAMPAIELFPRLTAAQHRLAVIRQRITETIHVARHGMPNHDDEADR